MKPPTTVDQMTPREAYVEGHRAGREELAAEMQRDTTAAKASESPTAAKARDDRLAAIDRRLTGVENEQRDQAVVVVGLASRARKLEGGEGG